MERTGGVFAEQVIRPTGLIDPPVEVSPSPRDGFSQVDDVIDQVPPGRRRPATAA
jgi:excinuclease ABC subunit B